MDYAEGLALLVEEGLGADVVYLDLGISSMQVDARERGFSYSYDAPLDMRMDPGQELDARGWSTTGTSASWPRSSAATARTPTRAGSRARSSGAGARAARDDRRAGRGDRGRAARRGAAQLRRRPPRQARLPGGPDRGQRRARLARPRAPAGVGPAAAGRSAGGDLVPLARGPAREALPGRAARAAACARPTSPVCVCGHEPEAELLTGRAVAPTPGEVAQNPRAKSGRLRAARRIAPVEEPDGPRRRSRRAPATHAGPAAPARRAAPAAGSAPAQRPPRASGRARRARPARSGRAARAALAGPRGAARSARRPRARRAAQRAHLDRPGRRAAGRDRLLQRRPAADEPRDHADGRPGRPAQARERRACARTWPGWPTASASSRRRPSSALVLPAPTRSAT